MSRGEAVCVRLTIHKFNQILVQVARPHDDSASTKEGDNSCLRPTPDNSLSPIIDGVISVLDDVRSLETSGPLT